jgi:hypothetical protein
MPTFFLIYGRCGVRDTSAVMSICVVNKENMFETNRTIPPLPLYTGKSETFLNRKAVRCKTGKGDKGLPHASDI